MSKTRFQKLMSMTIDEFADMILSNNDLKHELGRRYCNSDCGDDDCCNSRQCLMRWLESEVD